MYFTVNFNKAFSRKTTRGFLVQNYTHFQNINITITSHYIIPPVFTRRGQNYNLYLYIYSTKTCVGVHVETVAAGAAALECRFRQSTETHVRVAPISSNRFFLSRTNTQYGPRYVAYVHVGCLLNPHLSCLLCFFGWLHLARDVHLSWRACGARGGGCS